MRRAGPTNSILDVAGLTVGHAHDRRLGSGVSVVIADRPSIAAVHVMGGAPGTRDTDLLAPEETVDRIDALVLSGGSAFGLDAASGVQAWLRARGRGFAVGDVRVPIVPAAILFDLMNGGDKNWGRFPPYRDLGWAAAEDADDSPFPLGTIGAGYGCTTADLIGGLGSASQIAPSGHTVAALVAVNAVGSAVIGDTGRFWAAPHEIDDEFGGLGLPARWPHDATDPKLKGAASTTGTATTIAVIATDATLTKAQAKRLAIQAHDGFARALWPAHTPLDGDLVFALSTEERPLDEPLADMVGLGITAAEVMARAIARGVHAARPKPYDELPTWEDLWDDDGPVTRLVL
ncbi:P1 family peptidase [Pinisolibacter sp.]|uniref:P1 family peptidase n=1 Tax=Pinisolibacter sp. TaxID=2172024 RepID=UPI002FDE8485